MRLIHAAVPYFDATSPWPASRSAAVRVASAAWNRSWNRDRSRAATSEQPRVVNHESGDTAFSALRTPRPAMLGRPILAIGRRDAQLVERVDRPCVDQRI